MLYKIQMLYHFAGSRNVTFSNALILLSFVELFPQAKDAITL